MTLSAGPSRWDLEPLREAIMRYKTFPTRRDEYWFGSREIPGEIH